MRGMTVRSISGLGAVTAAAALAWIGACFTDKTDPTGSDILEGCRVPFSMRPGDVVVAMRDLRFIPETVKVGVGSTVIWVNCDDPGQDPNVNLHTVTSSEDPPAWETSPLFGPDTLFTLTFGQAGVFPYHCSPHRSLGMVGEVVVE